MHNVAESPFLLHPAARPPASVIACSPTGLLAKRLPLPVSPIKPDPPLPPLCHFAILWVPAFASIFSLTDDQDVALGGWDPMVQTRNLLENDANGAFLTNWRIHTPICSPSRSETVSGRYFHNIKSTIAVPPPELLPAATAHINSSLYSNASFGVYLRAHKGCAYSICRGLWRDIVLVVGYHLVALVCVGGTGSVARSQ